MSWFTKKKKAPEDAKKESSELEIETMREDLEGDSKSLNSNKEKPSEGDLATKKPEKASPFLMRGDAEAVAEKEVPLATETAEEKTPPAPLPKQPEPQANIEVEKKPPVITKEEAPKTPLETEEDKMEQIVKAANSKAVKQEIPSVVTAPKIDDLKKAPEKQESPIFIDRERKSTREIAPKSFQKESLSKNNTAGASPFGVPKKGIFVAKTTKSMLEKEKEGSLSFMRNFNKPLLILAVVIFLLTIVAVGVNYYRNAKKGPLPETPTLTDKENSQVPNYTTDNFAGTGIVLKTSKELLLADIKALIQKEKAINPDKFIGGQFIRPLQNQTEYLTGAEVLKIFGSEDSAINNFLDKPVMLFVTEEEIQVEEMSTVPTNGEQSPATPNITTKKAFKVALLLELKQDANPGNVIERLTEIETTFPGTLKSLMIEENLKLANERIIFNQATPAKKDFVHNIRYYNFKHGNVTRSIEWGSLLYKNKSYVFFSTSKEATNSLIEALN